ncbi:MAG: prolipoprotein diacylglyceryl transferase [Pseudomonadota bacterium]
MYPIILDLPGKLSINSYGLMLAIGFFIGIQLALARAKKENVDPAFILSLTFWIFIAAIVGSRMLHVFAEDLDKYIANPIKVFYLWEGGYAFYGGFLASFLVLFVFCIKNKMKILKITDMLAPSVAIGLAYGRMGCFLAGCCYGQESNSIFSVTFPIQTLGKASVPLLPTQTISSLNAAIIFLILTYFYNKKKFHGQIFFLFIILYSISRSTIEFFRDDHRGLFFNGLISTSQLISIGLIVILMTYWGYKKYSTKS